MTNDEAATSDGKAPMTSDELFRIATRSSPLALWQAEHVGSMIARRLGAPASAIGYVKLVTAGDKILDQALSKVGGKDLFVKEIELALLRSEAEVAVHSLKDVPTALPSALTIAAYPPREDPRDALVSMAGHTFESLPVGARVGTSSLRRAALLRRARPDLHIVPIRGNVGTRLKKLAEENMDATVLALAGLKRLNMESVVSDILPREVALPAIGQGILAVEIRLDDARTADVVRPLDDVDTRVCAIAERAFLRTLEGGCQVPIAGHAVLEGDRLSLTGLVASLDGQEVFEATRSAQRDLVADQAIAEALGVEVARELLDRGAGRILEPLRAGGPASAR